MQIYYPDFFYRLLRSSIAIFVLTFAALGLLLGYSESFDTDVGRIQSAVSDVEDRIASYVEAMRTSSELPEVKTTDNIDSISEEQMGIPEGLDTEKRQAAERLLDGHPEFESIFFLTPDGDVYLGEPFEQQRQLPRLNYADRDWYQGVSTRNAPYVSTVFMSAAINAPAVAVAVPVIAEDKVAGYWVAIVDLGSIRSRLGEFAGESRVLLVDHNANEVADTERTGELSELRSYGSLYSVQEGLAGTQGSLVETVDGVSMNARYSPVDASPNTWAMVFLEPVE
jgi:hypothetical protein